MWHDGFFYQVPEFWALGLRVTQASQHFALLTDFGMAKTMGLCLLGFSVVGNKGI